MALTISLVGRSAVTDFVDFSCIHTLLRIFWPAVEFWMARARSSEIMQDGSAAEHTNNKVYLHAKDVF
jgi:hypothetical protein